MDVIDEVRCHDCEAVFPEEDTVSAVIQPGADPARVCPFCYSDWLEPLDKLPEARGACEAMAAVFAGLVAGGIIGLTFYGWWHGL